jgi:hypothetical protein
MKFLQEFLFRLLTLSLFCLGVDSLAHPEFDLTDPAGNWWMQAATESTVQAKISEGLCIIRIHLRNVSPLLFTATFVANTGPFHHSGTHRLIVQRKQI